MGRSVMTTPMNRQYPMNGATPEAVEIWSTPAITAPCSRYVRTAAGASQRALRVLGPRAPQEERRRDRERDGVHQRDRIAPARDLGRQHPPLRVGGPVEQDVHHVHQQHGPRDHQEPPPVLRGDLVLEGLLQVGRQRGTNHRATLARQGGAPAYCSSP